MTEKRKAPTRRQAVEIVLRQDGRCAECGEKLQPGNIQYDHIHALVHGGGNETENFRAICTKPCHAKKTKADNRARHKENRITGKTKGRNKKDRFSGPRRGSDVLVEEPEPTARGKWPERKLQGRGFDKTRTKKMNGNVVDRVSHRAAVEAGYASHAGYIERWGKDKE